MTGNSWSAGTGFTDSWLAGTGFSAYTPVSPFPFPVNTLSSPTAVAAVNPPETMGIEPQAFQAVLYGKPIIVFCGSPLIGGRIIEGPWFGGTQADPTVSAIYSFGMPANPSGTRTITGVRLRGKESLFDGGSDVMAGLAVGNLTDSDLSGATVEFRLGTESQLPFQSSIDRYGSKAIAYRPHVLCELKNIPLKPFAGIVPFCSVQISDSTYGDPAEGITRTDALKEFLRYARYEDSEIEVDVQDRDLAWIQAEQTQLNDFLQKFRSLFVNWNITFRDKLRVIQPTSTTIQATLTPSNCVRSSIQFTQTDALGQSREEIYNFIDIDRDYEPNTATMRAETFPTATTESIDSETIALPIVANVSEAQADVSKALFEKLAAQDQIKGRVLPSLFGIEAGDAFQYQDNNIGLTAQFFETQRDLSQFAVDFQGADILNCVGSGTLDGDDDVVGIHIDPSGDPARPWLEIASLSCTDNGLMCGSFFFRADRGEFDFISQSFWGSNDNTSAWGLPYVDGSNDYVSGGIATDGSAEFIFANTSTVTRGDVHHCLFSIDTSVGGSNNVDVIYIDGVLASTLDVVPVPPTSTAFTPPFNGRNFFLFTATADEVSIQFTGDIWRMWLAPGQKLHGVDGTISAETIAKFLGADGRPMNLGSDGSTPTGVAPAVYFDGDADTFGTNRGTGGTFTQFNTFTTAPFPV